MAEHAAFRIARCSTSVDQAAALSWLLLGDLTQDKIIAKSLSELQEVFPEIETIALGILWQGGFTIDDKRLHLAVLVQIDCEALQVLGSLNDDDLGVGVCGLVQASLSCVCDVNASVHLVIHDSTKEGNGPLWRVKAHDSNCRLVRAIDLMTSLGKAHHVLIVLVPGPAELFIVALYPH